MSRGMFGAASLQFCNVELRVGFTAISSSKIQVQTCRLQAEEKVCRFILLNLYAMTLVPFYFSHLLLRVPRHCNMDSLYMMYAAIFGVARLWGTSLGLKHGGSPRS